MSEKPLFIPLKAEFFDAFKNGSKNTEWRQYGPRWNERTCRIGRPVVLSRGYGKKHRLSGVVIHFRKDLPPLNDAWRACYGDSNRLAACIQIELTTDRRER